MNAVFEQILHVVEPGSTVLDLGCDDCALLEQLARERNTLGRGVDIDDRSIQACIRKGISVFHGDLDEGLKDYPSRSYDYVILSRTLQQVRDPKNLLLEMLRVGRQAIVNYPNFAFWLNRLQLGIGGRMPENRELPYSWYDTPNIHFFTHRDFQRLCREEGITVSQQVYLSRGRVIPGFLPNLFATEVCCTLSLDV